MNVLGEIIGEPHNGLKAMFTMMNNARLNVGVQGVAIAERGHTKGHYLLQENENKVFLFKEKKESSAYYRTSRCKKNVIRNEISNRSYERFISIYCRSN